jgi:membrane protein
MDTETRRTSAETGGPGEGERSLGELFRELATESAALLRQEVALARAEMRRSVSTLGDAIKQLTIGSALAVVGLLTLTAFAVVLLGSLLNNYWLGALIVAVLLLGVGGALIYLGIGRLRAAELAPRETLHSLRVTGAWAGDEAAELRQALTADGTSDGAGMRLAPAMPGTRPALPAAGESSASRPGWEDRDGSARREEGASRGGGGTRMGSRAAAGAAEALSLPKRVGRQVMEDDILGESAKVAYYAFLALPPALLVIFALLGFFGGAATAEWITGQLQAALPEEASVLVDGFVTQVVNESAPGPFSIGLVLALWAASNVFMALGDALNNAYNVEETRSWLKRRAMAIAVMVGAVFLMLVASVSLIAGPQIAAALNLWGAAELAWSIVQWPLAFLFVGIAFFVVYYVLPNRDQSACRPLLFKAAVVAAALWLLASAGFRFYVGSFGSYSETYGFLGAVIVLLLWLYVTALVVLIGGELASEMEKDTR